MSEFGAARFLPRLSFHARALPSHPPLAMDWMVDQLRAQVATPPAAESNVSYVELGNENQDFEGVGGKSVTYRPSAMTMAYDIQWLPTGIGGKTGWIMEYSRAAYQWMEVDRISSSNRVAILEDELAATGLPDAAKKAKQDELDELTSRLAQLQQNQEGYAQTQYQCLNSGVSGLFWKLQAPNVPIKATSAFTLPQGRAVSLRLRRLKAPKEQARYNFTIFLANDKGTASTCYALRIGGDGNASEFFHFRSMKPARRKALFAAWDALEGAKQLTPPERKQILDWEEKELEIRNAQKKSGQPFTVEQSRELEALKENAVRLKDSKRLTAEDEETKSILARELFIERQGFNLQENANELLGKAVDITFHFLHAGYVVINSGETNFVYENKRVTGLNPPQYAEGLPAGCRITVESEGGMFRLVYGHPRYEQRSTLLSQPFAIPFAFAGDEVLTSFDGYDDLPGCEVNVSLERIVEASASTRVPRVPRYQLKIELVSTSREYSPELYWAGFHIPAGELNEAPVQVYNSQTPGNSGGVGGNWIRDVIMQAGEGRSPECTVFLGLQNDALIDPPLNVAALVGEVVLRDRATGDDINILRHARVSSVPLSELRGLDVSAETLAPRVIKGSLARYCLTAPLEWLDREVEAPFVTANYFPNDALRALFRDGGLPESIYARIPEGDIGIEKIPPTQPGRYPASKIAASAHLIEIAHDLVEKHCPGWDLIQDGDGIDLVRHGARDRPELAFDLPPVVPATSPLCLREEFTLEQETRDVVTGVTVYGARNPLTGVRFSHTETLPKMYQPGNESSVFWTGHENHRTLEPDETLTSVAACVRFAREYLDITPLTPDGLAPWTGKAIVNFNSTFRCGDIPRFFGVKFRIEDIDLGNLAADEKAGKVTLTVRLAQDKKLERKTEDA